MHDLFDEYTPHDDRNRWVVPLDLLSHLFDIIQVEKGGGDADRKGFFLKDIGQVDERIVLNNQGVITLSHQVLIEINAIQGDTVGKQIIVWGVVRGNVGEGAVVFQKVHQVWETHVSAVEQQRKF